MISDNLIKSKDWNAGKIIRELSKEIKDVLKEEFNYSFSKIYKPSKEIASRLLSKNKLLKISLFDKYLWFSFFKSFTQLFGYLIRGLQK